MLLPNESQIITMLEEHIAQAKKDGAYSGSDFCRTIDGIRYRVELDKHGGIISVGVS